MKRLAIGCVLLFFKISFSQGISKKIAESHLDIILNEWHMDAARSNLFEYFDLMSEDFVFLGTDPKERWLKNEFMVFCEPYFQKKQTWDFKPIERHWTVLKKNKMYCFDERIDTWMGDCRGSGVFIKTRKGWKISRYNLSVLIENEKINEFIKLRQNG